MSDWVSLRVIHRLVQILALYDIALGQGPGEVRLLVVRLRSSSNASTPIPVFLARTSDYAGSRVRIVKSGSAAHFLLQPQATTANHCPITTLFHTFCKSCFADF